MRKKKIIDEIKRLEKHEEEINFSRRVNTKRLNSKPLGQKVLCFILRLFALDVEVDWSRFVTFINHVPLPKKFYFDFIIFKILEVPFERYTRTTTQLNSSPICHISAQCLCHVDSISINHRKKGFEFFLIFLSFDNESFLFSLARRWFKKRASDNGASSMLW